MHTHEIFEGDYRFKIRLCPLHNGTGDDAAHGCYELYIRPILVKVMLKREPELRGAFRAAYPQESCAWKI
jgi:hypothetical protein